MKDIPGYEGLYFATRDGGIFNKNGRQIGHIQKGYVILKLCKDGKVNRVFAHRIIASVFIPNPEGKPQVNHVNGIKHDNRVENLEWCTISENVKHSWDFLGKKHSEEQKRILREFVYKTKCKKIAQLDEKGIIINTYPSISEASRKLNIHLSKLSVSIKNNLICGGFYWKCI